MFRLRFHFHLHQLANPKGKAQNYEGKKSAEDCQNCTIGTFNAYVGQPKCDDCPLAEREGMATCPGCNAGKFRKIYVRQLQIHTMLIDEIDLHILICRYHHQTYRVRMILMEIFLGWYHLMEMLQPLLEKLMNIFQLHIHRKHHPCQCVVRLLHLSHIAQ